MEDSEGEDSTSEGTSSSSDEETGGPQDEELGADEFFVDEVRIEGLPEPGEGVPSEVRLKSPLYLPFKRDTHTLGGFYASTLQPSSSSVRILGKRSWLLSTADAPLNWCVAQSTRRAFTMEV